MVCTILECRDVVSMVRDAFDFRMCRAHDRGTIEYLGGYVQMYGFHGKVLIIDLTSETAREEAISDDVLQRCLGGKGLGSHLLMEYLEPGADPLSAENKLVFATGPAADTVVPAASRFGVFARSPLTGYFGESFSGGHVAPVMKRTGYDAFMIEGAAERPVYLHISDDGVTFADASGIWGNDAFAAEDALLDEAGVDGAQAVVIGPAGENQVRFACIKNNYWRTAGRTGMGAVMGSKYLKGIVFSGSKSTPLADEEMLQEYVRDMIKECRDTERTEIMQTLGTPYMVGVTNAASAFPTRYWSEGRFEHWEGISSDAMQETMEVRPNACHRCFMACGKMSKVTEGRHKGLVLEGPEYETLYALGGICCVDSIDEVAYLNDLCDRLGLDTISGGNMVALGIEAGARGKLEGQPDYGDVDGIARSLKQIAHREGPGEILALGVRRAAEELGLQDLAIEVKGLEPAGYDPRRLPGMSLGYAVSERGACHLRSSFYMSEIKGEASEDAVDKTREFFNFENRNTFEDLLILCRFYQQFIGWDGMKTILEATTGMKLSRREMMDLASGVASTIKRFNIREGWTPKEDWLPDRLFEEPIGDDDEFVADEQLLRQMLSEYYRLHGWNEEGMPVDE